MSRRMKRGIPLPTDWLKSSSAKVLVRQALEAPADRRTQAVRILKLLIEAHGADVPLPTIMRCAAQYNACIHHLRSAGFRILQRSENRGVILHSWYRLEIDVPEDLAPQTETSREKRRATRPVQNMQLFASEQDAAEPPQSKPAQPAMVWRDPEMGGSARG